jgi:DNA-binding transcriptional regulator GbsR (MarR family)
MSLEILRKVGLTENAIRVYSLLLDEGALGIDKIHSHTGIERRHLYDILGKLQNAGLVGFAIEGKRKKYSATHPSRLVNFLEEKEDDIGKIKSDVNDILPGLVKRFEKEKDETKVDIYRGINGMKAIFEETLQHKENYYIAGNWGVIRFMPKGFWDRYNAKRIRNKVTWWDLVDQERTWDKSGAFKKKPGKEEYYHTREMPFKVAGPHVIYIYGNVSVQVIWQENPVAVRIESKHIADSYRKYFWYLWKLAGER